MELWKPECPFKLFQTKRFMNPKPVKGTSVAPVVPSSPAVASPTSIRDGQDDAAAESSTTTLPDAGSVQSSPQPDSRASTPTAKQSKFGPPLDLGVKSLKAFKVHETLRLYGSGVNLSAEENEAMQLDDSQLKADVSL